jgi:hypothetical protein
MGEKEERQRIVRTVLPPKKPLAQTLSLPLRKPQTSIVTPLSSTSGSTTEVPLSSTRNITGSKEAFDKGKFRLANATSLTEEKEEQIRSTLKPLSSLILSMKPQAQQFTGSGIPVIVRPAKEEQDGATLTSGFR